MKEAKLKKKLPPIYNLLILDDVMADLPRGFKNNTITSLFMNARHYSLSTMIVSQIDDKNMYYLLKKMKK